MLFQSITGNYNNYLITKLQLIPFNKKGPKLTMRYGQIERCMERCFHHIYIIPVITSTGLIRSNVYEGIIK